MNTEVAEGAPPSPIPDYPVRLSIERPDKQSRLTNFPLFIGMLIRMVLAIPNIIVLYFFAVVALLLYFIATFAILFTGRFPDGMRNFFISYLRWTTNLTAYLYGLRDEYPPFGGGESSYPAQLTVDPQPQVSRLLNAPFIGIIIKLILAIPHLVVLYLVGIVAALLMFIAQFAILFTGSFPAGMHSFVTGYLRWSMRLNAYMYALTDRYPPFSLE